LKVLDWREQVPLSIRLERTGSLESRIPSELRVHPYHIGQYSKYSRIISNSKHGEHSKLLRRSVKRHTPKNPHWQAPQRRGRLSDVLRRRYVRYGGRQVGKGPKERELCGSLAARRRARCQPHKRLELRSRSDGSVRSDGVSRFDWTRRRTELRARDRMSPWHALGSE
jgi:hypothetical protein